MNLLCIRLLPPSAILALMVMSLSCLPLPVLAQSEEQPPEPEIGLDLESVSITASRIPMSVSESGKKVSVLTQQDIARMPATSVDELLSTLPGVNINARQGFGMQADVGIRGSTFSQVLFMLDNVPLNNPLTAHFNTNIPVALSDIGQIELIRGPASAAFGADAVGGVVHIKTRSYMQRRLEAQEELQTRLTADISGGEHGLFDGALQLGAEKKRWRTEASFRRLRADGERISVPPSSGASADELRYNNYFELLHANAAASYQISERTSIYGRAGAEARDFNARYFYTSSPLDRSEEQISSGWALAALNHRNSRGETELNLSYRHVEDTFDFMPGTIPPNEHTTRQGFANISHQFELSGADEERGSRLNANRFNYLRFMIGGQYRFQNIRSTDRGDHERGMGGIYAISHLNFTGGVYLTASTRLQFHTRQAPELLPQLSVSYALAGDRLYLRSSAGRAIRTGDFTEQYVSSEIPDLLPGRNIGNPDLRPERSYSIDAGLDWRPRSWLLFAPTVFYRSSDQLIDFALTNADEIENADNLLPGEQYLRASNIEESSVRGLEILTEARLRLSEDSSLRLSGGYTLIRTTSDGENPSTYIANHPSQRINVGSGFYKGRFSLHIESSYTLRSAEAVPLINAEIPSRYFVAHLRSEVRVTRFFTLYGRVINLTDTEYQEILGAPLPRRWFSGGLTLQLGGN